MESEIFRLEDELEHTKEELRKCQLALQLREKQIKMQNKKQCRIEKVYKELLGEYENQIASMKKEIQNLELNRQKFLRKFRKLESAFQLKTIHNDNSVLLDAINSLGDLLKSNELQNKSLIEPQETTIEQIEKSMQEFCNRIAERTYDNLEISDGSPDEISALAVTVENSLMVAQKFLNALEKSNSKIQYWQKSRQQHRDVTNRDDHSQTDGQRELSFLEAWSKIDWEEVMSEDLSNDDLNPELDSLFKELQQKVHNHFLNLDGLLLKQCKISPNVS